MAEFYTKNKGFDLEVFRKANKLSLYVQTKQAQEYKFFEAFYTGEFSNTATVNITGVGGGVTNFLNNLFGQDLWRAALESAGSYFGAGSMSGSFDKSIVPFVQGTEPIKFDMKCFLPIEIDGNVSFEDNIRAHIDRLYGVCLPFKNDWVDKNIGSITDNLGTTMRQKFWPDVKGGFWDFLESMVNKFSESFLEGIYALDNPIQCDNSIRLKVGRFNLRDVLITSIRTDYSPMFYYKSDGGAYPAFCWVSLTGMTKWKATGDAYGINRDTLQLQSGVPSTTLASLFNQSYKGDKV